MSYEIIYQTDVRRIDGRDAGDGVERFVVAIEVGPNNCYEFRNKRSRS